MLRNLIVFLIALTPAVAQVTPTLLHLLPDEVKAIAGVNVAAARETPFGEYVLSQIEKHSGSNDEFLAATDFDLRQDLSEVVIGATGFDRESSGLMIARGVFNPERILALAESKGAIVSTFGDVRMIRGEREGSPAVAFLTMDMVAAGKSEDVLAVIERFNASEQAAGDAVTEAFELAENNHSWFILTGSVAELIGKDAVIPEGTPVQGDLIRSIEQLSGGVTFGETVVLTASAATTTPDSAAALGNVVQFFLSFARLNAENPETEALLGRILRDLDIDAGTSGVTVTLPIAQSDVEAFLETMHGHGHDEVQRTAEGADSGRRSRTGRTR